MSGYEFIFRVIRKIKNLFIIEIIKIIKSFYLSLFIDNKKFFLPIKYKNLNSNLKITKGKNSNITINGILYIESFFEASNNSIIHLGNNSNLVIDGDFSIGNGVSIIVDDNAMLYIGGKLNESSSGITENSRIMVKKKVHIGKDCIISWNVFITDCDWHFIQDSIIQKDVYIGDHVWIASNVSILKGSTIGNGTIVSTNTLTINKIYEEKVLLAGSPAKIVKQNVFWSRDMI